jgi:hypothetical protein
MFSNNTQPVHKNSPLEQEVPAQFLQLLQSLRFVFGFIALVNVWDFQQQDQREFRTCIEA